MRARKRKKIQKHKQRIGLYSILSLLLVIGLLYEFKIAILDDSFLQNGLRAAIIFLIYCVAFSSLILIRWRRIKNHDFIKKHNFKGNI